MVQGNPTLRTPEGERELAEGDAVCFPRGPAGAHQVSTATRCAVRVLILSTKDRRPFVEYLDSGKIGPGRGAESELIVRGPRRLLGRRVDYQGLTLPRVGA